MTIETSVTAPRAGMVLPVVLVTSVGAICFGAFLGGWCIASGHILLVLCCLYVLFKRGRLLRPLNRIPVSARFLYALLGISLLTCFVGVDDLDTSLSLVKKLRYIGITLLVVTIYPCFLMVKKYQNACARFGMAMLSLSIILSTVSGLIGHFTGYNPLLLGEQPYPTRNGGIHSSVMTYAYAMGIALFPFIALGIDREKIRHFCTEKYTEIGFWIIWTTIIIGTIGLYFSYTRGGALGLISGILVLMICERKWKLLAVICSLGFAVLSISIIHKSRYVSLRQYDQTRPASHSERLTQWKTAIAVFRENPVLGVGYRQFKFKSVDYKENLGFPKEHTRMIEGEPHQTWYRSHAHNNLLEHLASTGIFGGIFYIGFCIAWLKELWPNRLVRTLFFPAAIAFILSGMFENTFFDSEVVTVVFLFYVASQMLYLKTPVSPPE